MGKYRFGGGYEPLTPGRDSYRLDQPSIDRREIDLDAQEAKRRREEERKAFLAKYADDPVSQAVAFAEYELQQEEAAKKRQQQELDSVAGEHEDPVMKTWAIGQHLMKQSDAPEAQQAFADRERLEQIREQQKNTNRLNNAGLGFAPVRETIGAAVQTAESITAIAARLAGEQEAADQLYRDSGQFGQAREEARQDDMSPYLSRMGGGAVQSLMQTMATPGGAGAKIAGAGLMSASEALTTAEDAGLKGAARLRYAGTQGLLEAGVAALGQKILGGGIESRLAGESVAAETWKQLARNIGTDALKEMPEEVVTTILQDLSSKFEGVEPDLSFGDFVSNAVDSAVQAAMMAPMANAGNIAGMALRRRPEPPSDRQPVDPATQPAESPETAAGSAEQEKVPLALSPDSTPQIAPEIKTFSESPTRKNYEAAIRAGMEPPVDGNGKPIQRPNGGVRFDYATEIRKRQNQDLVATQDSSPLEPVQQEAQPGNVPDDEVESFLQRHFSEVGGSSDGQESNIQREIRQGREDGYQGAPINEGRQEGLLSGEIPAQTQSDAPPADSQPAAHTRESFEAEYRDTFKKMMSYPPEQAGHRIYVEKMADLYDSNPEWAREIENTPSPVGGTGEVRPDQSLPPATDPAFKFKTEKGSTYNAFDDGTTQRNKAARDEPGHEGDSGDKRRSAKTVYVDADASALSSAGLENLGGKSRVVIRDGKATLITWNEERQQWGASPSSRDIAVHTEPKVGRYPLELWSPKDDVDGYEAYGSMHAGNKIITMERVDATATDPASSETTPAETPPTSGRRADTPKWGIYKTIHQGKPKFSVKESASDKGYGDTLHDSEEEAQKYADNGRQREAERAAADSKRQANDEAAQKKQQEYEASFQGFLTDDPKTKGNRLKTLDQSLKYKDKVTTRKQLVEQKVADGWTVNDQDRLQSPTGEFLDKRDLTKTGVDYARHLVNQKPVSEKAVPWRRQAGEERADYNRKLKKEGWTKSPKPDISVIDSPGKIKAQSLEQQKNSPYKKGDRVTVHTGFSTDEMNIGGEVLEDSLPNSPTVKVRIDSGKVHYFDAYYTSPVKAGVKKQEPVQTVAGKMTYDEFESKGYSPEQVTKADWVNLQKSMRRSLGQEESSGTKAAPFADWEEYHRDAVKKAVESGDEVDKVMSWLKPWGKFPDEKIQVSDSNNKPKAIPAGARKPAASAGRSLRSIVLKNGGLNPKALGKDYNPKDMKGDGILNLLNSETGKELDIMAQLLESSGDLRTPEDRTPADWLMEQLLDNADGAKAQYSDKEIEAQLNKEREEYEKLKELLKAEDIDTSGLEELRQNSIEAGFNEEGELSDEQAQELIDISFDFGANVEARVGDIVEFILRGEKAIGLVTKVRPDGRLFVEPERRTDNVGRPTSTRYDGMALLQTSDVKKIGTSPFPATLNQFYSKWDGQSEPEIKAAFTELWNSLDSDDKGRLAGRLRKFGINAKVNNATETLAAAVAERLVNSRDIPGKIREVYDISMEYPNLQGSLDNDETNKAYAEMMMRIDNVGLTLPPMVRAAMVLPEMRRELLHDLAKSQFGEDIADTMFEGTDEEFKLEQPKKPKAKAEDFGTNANTKQGGLFDAGKPGELPGQNLLFDSDPGDVGNPKTQENKAKSEDAAAGSQEPSQEDLMEQILREELLGEKPAADGAGQKPTRERKPRTKSDKPAGDKPKRTRTQKAKEASKEALDEFNNSLSDFGDLFGETAPMGLSPDQMRGAARLVKAALNVGKTQFSEVIAIIVDRFGEPVALKAAEGLELAWRTLKRLDQYKHVGDVRPVSEILKERKALRDETDSTTSDKGMGRKPGTSGGELAEAAGGTPEGGDAEAETGSDDNAVSDGVDESSEAESDDAGTGTEGEDTRDGDGTESGTRRKPTKRRGRKAARGVSKPVGSEGNLRIKPDDVIAPGGVVSKLRANVAAITLLKKLQQENRIATPDEQKVLMKFTGWGSLQHALDDVKGELFLKQPGLPSQYGDWYTKAETYRSSTDKYPAPFSVLQERVQDWEKTWGEHYKAIKEALTPEQFKKAQASTLNAHFTSREVISDGIWGAMERFGVTGGRFLEPSSGIGSLLGLMPDMIANNTDAIAIELEPITGALVEQLYPSADVYVKGFESVPIPAGTIDFAATNVPFHKTGPADAEKRYGRPMNLHNYFIARILDSLRPGGIAAVISTHFTMDASPEDRALLGNKADLIGAIRLPNTAFKANAGTEVTTDIMFFRKPDGTPFKGESWVNLASVGTYKTTKPGKTAKAKPIEVEANITVNEYFKTHPEMVLGTHSMEGSQYSDEEYTVMPNKDTSLVEQLRAAVARMPGGIATSNDATPMMPDLDVGMEGVAGRIEFVNGKLQEWSKDSGWIAPAWLKDAMTLTKEGKPMKMKEETKAKNIANAVRQGIAYTRVRNAYELHIELMRDPDMKTEDYETSQKRLNDVYDAYQKAHGYLNKRGSQWLMADPGFFRTSGLETETEMLENGKIVEVFGKADVFTQRTVKPTKAPESAETTEEAVKISLAWLGSLNLNYMAQLTGKLEEDLETELVEAGLVFKNPETSQLEPADTYLAGNVHAKLRTARQSVADGDKRFEKNVAELEKVQPAKQTIDSITPTLGQNWIPNEIVNTWLQKVVGIPKATVKYNPEADAWNVRIPQVPRDVQNEWATLAMTLDDLIPKVLNGTPIRIMKPDPLDREKRVLDEAQTQATQNKAIKLHESFESWAKTNEAAIPVIEREFNEQKNFFVKAKYNGQHLTFPGMAEKWLKRIRPYQKDVVWRMIREGRGMLAHGVGAGKTLEMIALAMEMKRLGTSAKPLIVVQNSTLGQFARTFTDVYPAAKVLVATKDDLNTQNRARFMARIVTGNWDAIVMAKSTFNMKLPNDPQLEKALVDGMIDELKQLLVSVSLADGKGSPSVKALQQKINSLEARIEKIVKRVQEHRDGDVYFEQMGIDSLFLDEAHDYKKPPFVTKLDRNIKGLSTDISGRALAALVKMRFVQDKNRGRNTFMATGTPITNTLGESFLLMSMTAPDVLREFGVETFDQFVATFARVTTGLEPNPVGKLQRITRLSKFKNGHQLAQFIQSGWDVLLGDDLHDKIREYGGGKIPVMEGGKEMLHLVNRTKSFDRFGNFFLEVYDAYKALQGEDKRTYSWIPAVIYGAAKAASIDVRLVDPTAEDDPDSKLNTMINGVYDSYVEGTGVTLNFEGQEMPNQNLTQLIFSDISGRTDTTRLRSFAAREGVELEVDEDATESDSDSDEDRWLYNEIRNKLIAKGIPADQVALINEHNGTPDKLLAMQDKVNSGEIRIVIGHSDTLGTGVNVQRLLKDLWELDIPMVPAKRQQRIGRIIRSGNLNDEVRSHVMAMQRSLDSTLMAMNLRKAKAAEQALAGKLGAEFDDPYSETLLSMADMEAAMNDDPLFYRVRELEHLIRQRSLDVEALEQQKSRERERLRTNEYLINKDKEENAEFKSRINEVEKALKADGPYVIGDKKHDNFKAAEKAYKAEFDAARDNVSKLTQEGRIRYFDTFDEPDTQNFVAYPEFGPIKFSVLYGESKKLVLDDDGKTFQTTWPSMSGTLITIGGKHTNTLRGVTSLGAIIEWVKKYPDVANGYITDNIAAIAKREAENERLKEFLSKPSDAQVELENLIKEMNQVKQAMFERDNPSKVKLPPDPSIPITNATMPEGYILYTPGEKTASSDVVLDKWHIFAPGGFTITPGGEDTPHAAYHKAQQDPEHGDKFPALTAPAATPGTATTDPAAGDRTAAEIAREELDELRRKNSQYDSVIAKEWKALIWGRRQGTFLPLTPELLRAIGGRVIGTIRSGVKSFEVMVKEMRENMAKEMPAKDADETIRAVKPNLISSWNSMQEKYGLIPATEALFEEAMSDTVDVDLEQAVEAAKMPVADSQSTPTADPATPAAATMPAEEPERLYSTQNAYSAAERDKLGMEQRPEVPKQSRRPSVNNAKAFAQTPKGNDFINELIAELEQYPRAVTPYENDLLNHRNAELGEKLESALRQKNAAHKAGNEAEKATANVLVENYRALKKTLISKVLEPIGTAAGRALQARKAVINQDFTLQRMALEYESAFGKEPSPAQLIQFQEKIDALNAEIKKLEDMLAESEAKNEEFRKKLEENHSDIVEELKPKPSRMQKLAEDGRKQINDAFKAISAMRGKVYSVEQAIADAGQVFIDLALGYSKIGVSNVAEYLKRVKKRMGPDADELKDQLVDGWNKAHENKNADELSRITSKIDPMDDETIGRSARELHRFVIERDGLDASAAGREAAVDAVHMIMATFVPGITPDQVARAMSGIGVYDELSKDEIEVIRRDQKAQLLSLQQISDWKKGQAPPATGREMPPVSDEQRELRRLVNDAKKAAGIVTTTAGQLRSALDAAKRLAKNRIADLNKALQPGGKPISKIQKILKDDGSPAFAELNDLRAERDRLQKLYDEAFGKPELSDEQRVNMAEKALDRAISDMESELASGKLYKDDPKNPVTSPAIEAKRAQLAALKATRDEMRISSGESQARSDAAFERHLLEREAELAQRLASGNFAPIPKKPAREFTPSQLRTMQKIETMRQELRREADKWEFQNRSKAYQFLMKGPVAGVQVLRKVLTTYDQSLIGRQGFLLGAIHPFLYGKAIKKAFGSNWIEGMSIFPTEQDLFNTQTELDADEHWVRMEKIGKLAVTDVHGGVNREEDSVFMPEWVNKIPGVGGSERAGSAFINTQRRLVFRSLVEKLSKQVAGKRSITNSELRVIGNFVNISSGRGSLGKYANSLQAMTALFFSPRWWASRIGWLTGQPIWYGSDWFGGDGATREVRTMVAVEMAKQVAAQMAVVGIAAAALTVAYGAGGDDEEWQFNYDPRHADFGKLRIGQTMIDMTPGLSQHVSVFARMFGTEIRRWEGQKKAETGTILLNYGRGKLAPIPSMVSDFMSNNKKSMGGATAGSQEWFLDRFSPLIMQDVMNTTEKEGIPLGPILSLAMFFGFGAQTREERVAKRGDLANEVRAAKKRGESKETIQGMIDKHLRESAIAEAKDKLRAADSEAAAGLERVVAGTESPDLEYAIEKEKYDIALRAVEMLSAEDRTNGKGTGEDAGITIARDLLKQIAPTFEEANVLFTEAYMKRHGNPMETVRGRRVTKKSVAASRARLRAMYQN